MISNLIHPGKPTTQKIKTVRDNIVGSLRTSIRHHGQELGISKSSLPSILKKNLHLHAYKIQLFQELKHT